MKLRAATPFVQVLIVALASTLVHAQSVADVARAEREKNATQQAKPAKVYSNEDFSGRNQASQDDPSAGSSSPDCNEISAARDIWVLFNAEGMFSSSYGGGFTDGLNRLGPPKEGTPNVDRAGILDAVMSGLSQGGSNTEFVKSGYRFVYTPGAPDTSGHITTCTITARPLQYGVTGKKSFFHSRYAFETDEDRPATEKDPREGPPPYPSDKLHACSPMTVEQRLEQGDDYGKWPVRDRQKLIAKLEMIEAEAVEGRKGLNVDVVPEMKELFLAGDKNNRDMIEKIRNANPHLPPDSETGGSLEAKRRKYYSLLSEAERRDLIAVLERSERDPELNKYERESCDPGNHNYDASACDDQRKFFKNVRDQLQLLRSTPPAP